MISATVATIIKSSIKLQKASGGPMEGGMYGVMGGMGGDGGMAGGMGENAPEPRSGPRRSTGMPGGHGAEGGDGGGNGGKGGIGMPARAAALIMPLMMPTSAIEVMMRREAAKPRQVPRHFGWH